MGRDDVLADIEQDLLRVTRIANSRSAARNRERRAGVRISRTGVAVLIAMEAGHHRVTDIAQHAGAELPVASREARALVDQGYVTRAEDESDARSSRLSMTPAGCAALAAYRQAAHDILDEALAEWSTEDLEALRGSLRRLAHDFARDR